jgi:hypothetical protein
MNTNKNNISFKKKQNKFSPFKKNFPLNVKSLKDLEHFNQLLKFTPFETFGENVDENDVWYYELNDIGLRGNLYKNKDVECAFFGCSFTFGQGVQFEKTWPYIVGERLFPNKWINFGQMGISFRHMADVFIAASQIYDIKNAIFLLPMFERNKVLIDEKDDQRYCSIIPHLESGMDGYSQAMKFYKNYDELQQFLIFMDTVLKIKLNAQVKRTNVIWATYDMTSKEAFEALGISYIYWDNPFFPDIGRDGSHPGPIANKKFAKQIISHIKNS